MGLSDYIGNLLQIERIKSPEPVPVSGTTIISVETKLQYSQLFPLVDDGDIVYLAYLAAAGLLPTTLTGTADGSGNVDLSAQPIPLWAKYALYGGDGNQSTAFYNGGTKMITGMSPGETYHFTY